MSFPMPPKVGSVISDKLKDLDRAGSFTYLPRTEQARSRRNAIHTQAKRLGIVVRVGPCPAGATLDADRYFGIWRVE